MGTLFQNATLTQLDPPLVERGNLRQQDGTIVAMGPDVAAQPDDEVVPCEGAVLMPGLVNGHTHLYSALAAGMPAPVRPPRDFFEILQFVWWRLDRAHTLPSIEVSGQIGALAALRCGTTTLFDHHASPSAIDGSLSVLEQGIGRVGLRGVLCYETTDRNSSAEAARGLAENSRYAQHCAARTGGQFAAMVGAHASFTLEEQSLLACVDLARRSGVGVHIHVAEDPVDQRRTREQFGCDLFDRFRRCGVLETPGTILAHGTHLSEADYDSLGAHPETLWLAHNPNSNMNNAVGYAPIARLRGNVLLGTDGIGADLWREARTAQFKSHDALQPLPFGRPLTMIGENARRASHCLGVRLGVLEAGAAADLVLTSFRPASPLSADSLASHFLFAMGPEFVRDVMIDGRWRLRGGEVVSCDEAALRAGAVQVARALHQRMDELPWD